MSAGAKLFGYINEVNADFLKKNPKYKRGDYVGVTGLERSYEDILGGTNGYTIYLRDVHNRVQSHFAGGAYDKLAIPGEDITTTIDGYLQQYGEKLMRNKVGSLVAIEPSTGEILTLVSSPGIEIEKLADIRNNYNEILNDPYKPMFNRAVMSAYPPGLSTRDIHPLRRHLKNGSSFLEVLALERSLAVIFPLNLAEACPLPQGMTGSMARGVGPRIL